MDDFFKFENKDLDFPFYNRIPKISAIDWLVLLLGLLMLIGIFIIPYQLDDNIVSILICLVLLVPLLYVSRGKISLFVRKPEKRDIKLIILCLLGYYAYTLTLSLLLSQIGIETTSNVILETDMDIVFWITTFIQLFGEELIKIVTFLITLFLTYKLTNNRKISVICGVITSMLFFGLLHYNAYNGALVQIISIIGIGSIFCTYPYLKTKNIVPGYIVHVLIDSIVFILTMLL